MTAITKKQAAAMELRINGFTLNEIAERLGYADPSGAQRAILAAQKKTLQEPADELRKLHRQRLSKLMRVLSTDLCAESEGLPEMVCPACGETLPLDAIKALDALLDKKHAAIDRILKVLRREAEMEGLDAAKGIELQGNLKIVLWGDPE
jgi:DNA-binding transcriptional MerR regulator